MCARRMLRQQSDFDNDYVYIVCENKIFCLRDKLHMLKCFRKNFITKNIHFGNKIAKWDDLNILFKLGGSHPEGNICPRNKSVLKFTACIMYNIIILSLT